MGCSWLTFDAACCCELCAVAIWRLHCFHAYKTRAQVLWLFCRKGILSAAGFIFTRLVQTRGVFSLVEAAPAVDWQPEESSKDAHLKQEAAIPAHLEREP